MGFQRIVHRTCPDGVERKMYPFHICLEGMESILLCREDEDYDHLQKSFYLSALKCNCRVIIDIAMSNHGHVAALAPDLADARRMGFLIKQRHAQFIRWKYHEAGILRRSNIYIQYLDSDSYVRNTLAYIPRNVKDTSCRIEDYRWSGYRGMFVQGKVQTAGRPVSSLTRREKESIFHTHEDLSRLPWILNMDDGLEPASACDYAYLESAFAHDQTFFLKTIGSLNEEEMQQQLLLNKRRKLTDKEFLPIINDMAEHWYNKTVAALTPNNKARMLKYLKNSYRSTPSQLARCLQMPYSEVTALLKIPDSSSPGSGAGNSQVDSDTGLGAG